jgi:hypothetical protein
MNTRHIACTTGLAALLCAPNSVFAQIDAPDISLQKSTNKFAVSGVASFTWQGDANLDEGSAFQVNRIAAGANATYRPCHAFGLGAYFIYRREDYNFSGTSGFGGLDPWNDINQFRVAIAARFYIKEHWTLMGAPILDYAGETGVSFTPGRNLGGVGAVSYARDENLSLGLGVVALQRQQELRTIYPLVLFNWRFAPDWVLRNGSFPLGPNGAAGVELAWDFIPGWEVSVSGQYQTRLFRLNDSGPEPDGFGLEDAIPVFGTLSYRMLAWLRADVFAGAMLSGDLELEHPNGHRVSRQDYNPAPFIGVRALLKF